jgi:hypothetical protein
MNTEALLALQGDLYAQVVALTNEVRRLGQALAEAQQPEPDDQG